MTNILSLLTEIETIRKLSQKTPYPAIYSEKSDPAAIQKKIDERNDTNNALAREKLKALTASIKEEQGENGVRHLENALAIYGLETDAKPFADNRTLFRQNTSFMPTCLAI